MASEVITPLTTLLIALAVSITGIWFFFIRPLLRIITHKSSNKIDEVAKEDARSLLAGAFVWVAISFMTYIVYSGYLWTCATRANCRPYEGLIAAVSARTDEDSAHIQISQLLNRLSVVISEEDKAALKNIHGCANLDEFNDRVSADPRANISTLCNREFAAIMNKYSGFLSPNSDAARVIYETNSILSYAAVILTTCVTFFIPILLWLWTNAKQRVEEKIVRLINGKSIAHDHKQLDGEIQKEFNVLSSLEILGRDYKIPFGITLLFLVVLLASTASVIFSALDVIFRYEAVVCLFALSLCMGLWLLVLLITYHIRVQPLIRDHKALEVLHNATKVGAKHDA